MSTRFFEHQDAARRNTRWLIFLFCLAVLAITALLYALAVVLSGVQQADPHTREVAIVLRWWQPDLLLGVVVATFVVVAGGGLMPRVCTICTHKAHAKIDRVLVERQAFRAIARQFGVSKDALLRHHDDHLPAALVKAQDATEAAQADALLAQVVNLRHSFKIDFFYED